MRDSYEDSYISWHEAPFPWRCWIAIRCIWLEFWIIVLQVVFFAYRIV